MGLEGDISWCSGSKGTRNETSGILTLPPSTCHRLLPLERGQMGDFIACATDFEGEPSPANLNQPVWHPGLSLSFVTKNTGMSSSREELSCPWTLPCRRSWERRKLGQRWAEPLSQKLLSPHGSSCPHVEAQWKGPGLSACTRGPCHLSSPGVRPLGLGGGNP